MEQRPAREPGPHSKPDPKPDSRPDSKQFAQQAQVAELQRRIRLLEAEDDGDFGAFTAVDWLVCVLGAVVIPVLVLLWVGR